MARGFWQVMARPCARTHWSIEHSLHWVPDMSSDEDRARDRKDKGPENLCILRKLPLSILRKARPKRPVSRKRKRAGWSGGFAEPIIGQMRSPREGHPRPLATRRPDR